MEVDEVLELPATMPAFAEPEYTVPKTTTSDRLGSIRLDSADFTAPYGFNKDGTPAKKRGRPVGSRNLNTTPKLATTRDSKEVEKRVKKLLQGTSGVASVWRSHIEMTDQEATDIADPLSAYLIRQEQFSSHIKDFLDHYDLAAAGVAFLAYLVRVWKDDVDFRREQDARRVVEDVSNRRVSRRRDQATDATTGEVSEVMQPEAETSGQQSDVDGRNIEFPVPYITRD